MVVTGGRSFTRFRGLLERGGAGDPFAQRVTRHHAGAARGEYVVYWMQAARRVDQNLALALARQEAASRGLPLLVYEALRPDYPGANDRIHRFILEGVADRIREAGAAGLRYAFFLPRTAAEARGVMYRIAARAACVVTDEYPAWMLRDQTRRFIENTGTEVVLVDHNGILPMRSLEKEQYAARQFRDRAHRLFDDHWPGPVMPVACEPWRGEIPFESWDGRDVSAAVERCAVDHSVPAVSSAGTRGEALARVERFIRDRLEGYDALRNRKAAHTSELSPYLHFGLVGTHEVANAVLRADAPARDIDSFLEELVIRRELSFNFCFYNPSYDSIDALPDWARTTLREHRDDRREPLYDSATLESADTHDEVWNLTQRALIETGTIHNYLRMLWGKKILEWSATPREAYRTMIELHERWALDGRDPNTYANVLWCLGKHDRAWGERPIFGKVRYMSSEATRRKVDLDAYARHIGR